MDDLLKEIGQEANQQVDFEGAFARILAQSREEETSAALERAKEKRAARRRREWTRYLSMACLLYTSRCV